MPCVKDVCAQVQLPQSKSLLRNVCQLRHNCCDIARCDHMQDQIDIVLDLHPNSQILKIWEDSGFTKKLVYQLFRKDFGMTFQRSPIKNSHKNLIILKSHKLEKKICSGPYLRVTTKCGSIHMIENLQHHRVMSDMKAFQAHIDFSCSS